VELSCKHEYAVLALLELVSHYGADEPLQIRQIAIQQRIPDRYLEQLLATLRRAGLVRSQRGAKGGYMLARDPQQITLYDIVSGLEGLEAGRGVITMAESSGGLSERGSQVSVPSIGRAVISEIWTEADGAARQVLQGYTLQDLSDRQAARKQLDIMYYI
jgi:Rrf2 family protein